MKKCTLHGILNQAYTARSIVMYAGIIITSQMKNLTSAQAYFAVVWIRACPNHSPEDAAHQQQAWRILNSLVYGYENLYFMLAKRSHWSIATSPTGQMEFRRTELGFRMKVKEMRRGKRAKPAYYFNSDQESIAV